MDELNKVTMLIIGRHSTNFHYYLPYEAQVIICIFKYICENGWFEVIFQWPISKEKIKSYRAFAILFKIFNFGKKNSIEQIRCNFNARSKSNGEACGLA